MFVDPRGGYLALWADQDRRPWWHPVKWLQMLADSPGNSRMPEEKKGDIGAYLWGLALPPLGASMG